VFRENLSTARVISAEKLKLHDAILFGFILFGGGSSRREARHGHGS